MPEGKHIAITGGAGFIGSYLVERLAPTNKVVVFDSFVRDSISERLDHIPPFELVRGDILDAEAVRQVLAGADIVIHCAAIAGIDTVIRDPVHTLRVNILGSWNVLDAVVANGGADRVVCFSTSEVFGRHADTVDEECDARVGPPGAPRYTYAAGKLAEEHLALAYHRRFDVPSVVLRPFNVYGPRQVGEGAIRSFILRALAGEELVVSGTGRQIRAWTYVEDMVDGVLAALEVESAVGRHFNIGNPHTATAIGALAELVIDMVGSTSRITYAEGDDADVAVRIPDVRRATELLGFTAKWSLEEGLNRTIEYYRSRA